VEELDSCYYDDLEVPTSNNNPFLETV